MVRAIKAATTVVVGGPWSLTILLLMACGAQSDVEAGAQGSLDSANVDRDPRSSLGPLGDDLATPPSQASAHRGPSAPTGTALATPAAESPTSGAADGAAGSMDPAPAAAPDPTDGSVDAEMALNVPPMMDWDAGSPDSASPSAGMQTPPAVLTCASDRPCADPAQICQQGVCLAAADEGPGPGIRPSAWSSRAGWVDEQDRTHFCTPQVEARGASPGDSPGDSPSQVTSRFEQVRSDGSPEPGGREPRGSQRLRAQCQRDAASSASAVFATSAWSSDDEDDLVSVQCPADFPYLAFAHCQVATTGVPAYVYSGTACGAGISGLGARPELLGQMFGARYELTTADTPKPLFNDTRAAGVIGADLGYQFFAQGRLHIGFGDTWENELMLPGPLGLRGTVLAYTRDLDPSDGIVLEGWETMPDNPRAAREVIPSEHGILGLEEYTAIATTGVGLTEGETSYRFLWFAAIRDWDPFESIESTLAWSIDGGAFVRGDQQPEYHPPRWPHGSYFGPGAMWFDREHGMIYLFGVRTYVPEMPIRLARVRATPDALRDHLQYEYWTGSEWRNPDPADEYALAALDEPAANLIPGSMTQSNRPEISVAYNAFAGRYVMMLQNDLASFRNEEISDFQLWQSESITGPWSKVDIADGLKLPGDLYGPYTSDHLVTAGGEDVYMLLSEWNLGTLLTGQPYSVGLWRMGLKRELIPGCLSD